MQTGYGTSLAQDTRRLTYTAWGAVDTLKDAEDNLTKIAYDGFGRPTTTLYPDKFTAGIHSATDYTQLTYDPTGGRVTATRRRSGQTLTFDYDNLGRVTQKIPSAGKVVAYDYDHAGRATQAKFTDNSYVIDAVFDALGRTTRITESGSQISGANRVIDYGYDAASRRTSITYPDGQVFDYSYDTLNRMTLLELAGDDLAAFTYDDRSRRTLVDIAQGDVYTDYTYADDSALERLSHDLAAGGVYDVTIDYTRNELNQITKIEYSSHAYLWWQQDDINDSYTANGLNQYIAVGGSTLTYDDNGNLTGDGTWTFAYDAENRLTSASTSGTTATYEYDPLGRRSAKVVNGLRTEFLYDGTSVILEYDGSGAILRRYVYGPGIDERLFYYDGATTAETDRYAIHTDHLGSTIALTDKDGRLKERFSYGPFGETADTSGCAYRFTGRYLDAETGLYYYRARYYSPDLGRFLNPDPSGYGDGMNLYAYVGNDPVNYTDPSGLFRFRPGGDDEDDFDDEEELEEIVVIGERIEREPPDLFDDFDDFDYDFDDGDSDDDFGDRNDDSENCTPMPVVGAPSTINVVALAQNVRALQDAFVFQAEAVFGLVLEAKVRALGVVNAGAGIDAGTFRTSAGTRTGIVPDLRLTQGAFGEASITLEDVTLLGGRVSTGRSGAVGTDIPHEEALANQPFEPIDVDAFTGLDVGAAFVLGASLQVGIDLDKLDFESACTN